MKRLWLKITGLTIFVLAAIIGIYILRPAESPDVGQIPQQDASTSTIQPNIENPQLKRQLTPDDFQPAATSKLQDRNPRLQEHRDRAAMLSSIYRNPDSPEAAKARESLLKAPQGQFAPFRKDNDFKFLKVPPGINTKQVPPKPSPQDGKQADPNMGQVSRQYPANPKLETAKETSKSIIREHLRQYKANRSEMFPSYANSLQIPKYRVLTRRLPQRYQRLFSANRRESSPSFMKQPSRVNPGQFRSFTSRRPAGAFKPKGTKTLSHSSSKVSQNKPNSPTTNKKVNVTNKTAQGGNK